jgi:hypothetical protein
MAMRETERSLRWFFLIAGALSALQGLAAMNGLSRLPHGISLKLLAPLWYGTSAHIVLGALFFLAGLRLKQALQIGATWIQHLIVIAGAALIIEVLWIVSVFGVVTGTPLQAGLALGGVVGIGIRIAVVAYLHASVRRLSAEAQAATALR